MKRFAMRFAARFAARFAFGWAFIGQAVLAYPGIVEWTNAPLIVFENNKSGVLTKNRELKSPFFIVTSRLDEIRLRLNPGNEMTIFKNSKMQVYEVFEDPKQEHNLFLIDGGIELINAPAAHGADPRLNRVKTPFFDLAQPASADAIVILDMKEPSVEIKMLKGVWDIAFFNYEKKVQLKSGQQVKFKGVLADDKDQIKYDFLLEDKKVPKGELGAVEKFDAIAYRQQKQVADRDMIKKQKQEKQKVARAANAKAKRDASFLCKDPFGQLNQCTWKVESEKCFRQRCNAAGVWGDRTERPVTTACTKDFLVGSCDY